MKSKDILKEFITNPSIAEDCSLFDFVECETNKDFVDQIRSFFGEGVCEIITSEPKIELAKRSSTYVYGYTDTHILDRMPDIILVLYSDEYKENGKCVFLWRIDD